MGVACPFRLPFFSFRDSVKENENPFRGYLLQILRTEFLAELGENQLIRPDRVFFRVRLVILQLKFCCLRNLHNSTSLFLKV